MTDVMGTTGGHTKSGKPSGRSMFGKQVRPPARGARGPEGLGSHVRQRGPWLPGLSVLSPALLDPLTLRATAGRCPQKIGAVGVVQQDDARQGREPVPHHPAHQGGRRTLRGARCLTSASRVKHGERSRPRRAADVTPSHRSPACSTSAHLRQR